MDWLWIIVALLIGLVIGYLLARRACDQEHKTTLDSTARIASLPAAAPAPETTEPDEPAVDPSPLMSAPEPDPTSAHDEPGVDPSPTMSAPEPEPSEPDDLRRIEGIGPKIAQLMNGGGIFTFAQMAASSVERLQGILDEAGDRYRVHNPGSWPMQAGLAADDKWDELGELQDRLDGGKLT